ncbi:MAG TPA: hypothetical protein VLZ77_09310, partial [Acidimicrobiales bacterium]|nr:hypothetical protein [Acidimicrobiales bacterium]
MGMMAVLAGGVMLVTTVTSASGATPTLSITDTAAGASCNNSNPSAPICTGVAGGQTLTVAGTGFAAGALASIIQCNDDPTQPIISFLANDIPVSCSALKIVTIPSSGASKGKLSGTQKIVQGTVGPPVAATPDSCTQDVPSTSAITGCTLG